MSALTLTPRALYEEVAEQLRQRIFRRELGFGIPRAKYDAKVQPPDG